ncbi:response regulator transcription factor [Paenibacillus turpanensis]|uniref:response regulator transcription factor n=1 Tax=Paenibacillus turpanensis TaxID=2689078 RepID=UPI00140A06DC|nr:response regulator transcription factor [Paenibacillus turpanensis]
MEELKNKKLLLVDDERDLREMVDGFLRKEGFTRIYQAATCAEALELTRSIRPEMIILDIMLPDGDGFSLLSALRQHTSVPVLFLSARGEDADRLLGLGLGADDYLAKPFLPRELVLRLTAILRRVYTPPQQEKRPVFQLGSRLVDLESGVVRREGLHREHGGKQEQEHKHEQKYEHEQPLTAKELVLLAKFYENRNRIVTNDALCQAAWNDDYYGYENTLMVHIRRIREKIEDTPSDPQHLLTVRGLGYKLLVKEEG